MLEDRTIGRIRRRPAVVLFASYNRLQPGDEADSFTELSLLRTKTIEPQIHKFGGRMIRWAGDEVLLEFKCVVEAVRCAIAFVEAVSRLNDSLPPGRRIAICIGINLTDIIVEGDEIFGDGVNIASRLKALAEPGTIYISGAVHDRIVGKIDFDLIDLGPQKLKNISRPINLYRIDVDVAVRLAAASAGTGSTAAARFHDGRAIAVLPFANFGGDADQEYFADGITEDIISMLAGWRAFPVIARNSTFNYKGKTVDVRQIGEELGVRYVLEGSVRKSGHRVRVTAQLIFTDTGHHLIAEKYDRDLTDLFELQDEIVSTIAGAIEPELLKFERERITERPPRRRDAYDLYQRGMFHHYQQNKADNIDAQGYFRRVLALDPQYPQATAALSISLSSAAMTGWADDADARFEEACDLAQRAVVLDPRYPNAHFALGLACMWTQLPQRAIAAFEVAIRLNPSFAASHVLLAQMYLYAGRREEAIRRAEKGIRLSPSDPRLFIWLPALAGAHYQMRRYGEAVEAGRRSWSLNRNWPHGLRYVVAGLGQMGRTEEARAALAELKLMDANLEASARVLRRNWSDPADVDHLLEGLRKAGFE